MRHSAPDLPPTPPLDWPSATAVTSGAAGPHLAAGDGDDTDPWTTWQVALIAAVAVLVGLAVGVATGVRIAATESTVAAAANPVDTATGTGAGTASSAVGAPDPAPPHPADHGGTRQHPVPLGASHIGDGHSLRILSLGDDGVGGMQVRLELVVSGDYTGSTSSVEIAVLDDSGAFHDQRSSCGVADGGLERELPPGEAHRVQVCFAVPAHRQPGSLLVAEVAAGEPVHYALS
jgi:hypothetical protein